MKRSKKIWFNGKLIDWNKAKVHVLTHALHYGSGVFEGIRCYNAGDGPAIFRLDDHIKRLAYSSECLGMEAGLSIKDIKKAVIDTIRANKINECYIRPVIFCGYGEMNLDISNSFVNTAIIIWPWASLFKNSNGISTIISSNCRFSPKAVPVGVKINGYYVNSIIATNEAKKHGVDEAILLDSDGYVAEGSGENIFTIKKGVLYTPILGHILPGITRNSIMIIANDMGLRVKEKRITVKELKESDEVFFSGTAAEICPVIKIDNNKIGKGVSGPISLKIRNKYSKVVRGEDKKYKKWLTYV